MRLLARAWTPSAFVLMGCSTGQPPPDQELRYETAFFPEYYETERIGGAPLAAEFDQIILSIEEGKARYEAGGRSIRA